METALLLSYGGGEEERKHELSFQITKRVKNCYLISLNVYGHACNAVAQLKERELWKLMKC